MRKVTANIEEPLYKELSALSAELEHKSISQTLNYLLERAIYTEREKTFAPLMRTFIKNELDNYTNTLDAKLEYMAEEVLGALEERVVHLLYSNTKLALAALIASTWAVTTDEEDAAEIQQRALNIAFESSEGI